MNIQKIFEKSEKTDLLRFLTCGSVDDGKSTLIGRLLHDSKLVYEDHLKALKRDSERRGSVGGDVDYSLLLDGLKAEREQGITIDVAYRYFSTPRRKFIIADTPGHEQYTRNMATGASSCDLAVILIDARHGVLDQTRRHSFIASLLGIRHLVVAVNKMDLVDYSEDRFHEICEQYSGFAAKLETGDIHFIPISALKGDNVVEPSTNMSWFEGRPLLAYLESVVVDVDRNLIDMRFPVQYVLRPDLNFRGYSGTVASGIIRKGDAVKVLPSGKTSRVERIVTFDGDVDCAFTPMAVTVTLEDEVDISRGDMLVHTGNTPNLSRSVEAMVVWMQEEPLEKGKQYLIKHTANVVPGRIHEVTYKTNINTMHREKTDTLGLNEIGRVNVMLNRPVAYDSYAKNRGTGCFIMVDPLTNATVAAGMIVARRGQPDYSAENMQVSEHVEKQQGKVTADMREQRLQQKPLTVWLTGLPCAGKTTIAYALEAKLHEMGYACYVLDGQNMRLGVSRNLGFSQRDRAENIRRAAGVARMMNEAGLVVIAAFVSPMAEDRVAARAVIGEDQFVECYLSTPKDVCVQRDEDNLYARAENGEIKEFSGVSAPYEIPVDPDLSVDNGSLSVVEAVDLIAGTVQNRLMVD